MGAYFYVTSPKLTAKARVRLADGTEAVMPVALYRYAYKPYGGWSDFDRKANRRMHFKFGAAACISAYARSATEVPEFGICFDEESKTLYPITGPEPQNATFRTNGLAGGLDDYDFCSYQGAPVILEYLELPKGFSVKPAKASAQASQGGF